MIPRTQGKPTNRVEDQAGKSAARIQLARHDRIPNKDYEALRDLIQ